MDRGAGSSPHWGEVAKAVHAVAKAGWVNKMQVFPSSGSTPAHSRILLTSCLVWFSDKWGRWDEIGLN
jgi:hypothetical protein